jgi:hypothetical protein
VKLWCINILLGLAACSGGGERDAPPDAYVPLQYITVNGQTSAVHAVTAPEGIDCGPASTLCQHGFVERSLVHLHIEQVDLACGTATLEFYVPDGSGSTQPVPYKTRFAVQELFSARKNAPNAGTVLRVATRSPDSASPSTALPRSYRRLRVHTAGSTNARRCTRARASTSAARRSAP